MADVHLPLPDGWDQFFLKFGVWATRHYMRVLVERAVVPDGTPPPSIVITTEEARAFLDAVNRFSWEEEGQEVADEDIPELLAAVARVVVKLPKRPLPKRKKRE